MTVRMDHGEQVTSAGNAHHFYDIVAHGKMLKYQLLVGRYEDFRRKITRVLI